MTPEEAIALAEAKDCPNSKDGGLHCNHYQDGDSDCHNCGRAAWCPNGEDGDEEMEQDLAAEREMDKTAEAINEEARKRGWI